MSVVTATNIEAVANLALDMVKEAPILSIDENRAAARWMKRNFWPVAQTCLTMHIWKFAMKRASIPADAQAPEFEWQYKYRKPTDCLRVLPLRVGGRMDGRLIPHQVEGDYILTNAPGPLKVRYIATQGNIATWPPLFVEAVACKLAARIAPSLTGKQSMVEINEARYAQTVQLAISIDSAEGSHAQQYATEYDDARNYYSLSVEPY